MVPALRDSFASIVRAVGGVRHLVTTGAVTASIATGLAGQALASENGRIQVAALTSLETGADVSLALGSLKAQKQLLASYGAYFEQGLKSIASADLSALSPSDALATIQAMAAETLKGGPKEIGLTATYEELMRSVMGASPADLEAIGMVHGQARLGAEMVRKVMRDLQTLAQEHDSPLPKRPVARQGYARQVLEAMGGQATPKKVNAVDVIRANLNLLDLKMKALIEISNDALDPRADLRDVVLMASHARQSLHPAEKALLESWTVNIEDIAEATRSMANPIDRMFSLATYIITADDALRRIEEEWRANRDATSLERISDIAQDGLKAIGEQNARTVGVLQYESMREEFGLEPR